MQNNWFILNNLKDFINASRVLVFNNFGSEESSKTEEILLELNEEQQKELDIALSYNEAFSIAKNFIRKQKNKTTARVRYILNEDIYLEIINALNDRLVSNILNSLVNKGIIETAFDETSNDFVFWIKDEHKKNISQNIEKPETD